MSSEFEAIMARRRALQEGGTTPKSDTSNLTTTPKSAASSTLSPELVLKLATRRTTSDSPGGQGTTSTPKSTSTTPSPSSKSSELANKLAARRAAIDSTEEKKSSSNNDSNTQQNNNSGPSELAKKLSSRRAVIDETTTKVIQETKPIAKDESKPLKPIISATAFVPRPAPIEPKPAVVKKTPRSPSDSSVGFPTPVVVGKPLNAQSPASGNPQTPTKSVPELATQIAASLKLKSKLDQITEQSSEAEQEISFTDQLLDEVAVEEISFLDEVEQIEIKESNVIQEQENKPDIETTPSPIHTAPKPKHARKSNPLLSKSSQDKTTSLVWTGMSCYVLPLSFLFLMSSIFSVNEASKFYWEVPRIALLETFPPSKTEPTNWVPMGMRMAHGLDRPTSPVLKASRAHRGSDTRDGYIWTAAGPRFESSWTAEPTTLIQNSGIAFDDAGHLFFSPTFTVEDLDVSLIALDAQTGERAWTWKLPPSGSFFSFSSTPESIVRAGAGTPLILNDPEALPEKRTPQFVYHATRTKAHCLKTSDGSDVWTMPTGVTESEDFEANRMWGLSYVPKADALVGVTNDGIIFVLDRATGNILSESKKLPCSPPPPVTGVVEGIDTFKAAFPGENIVPSASLLCVMSPLTSSPTDSNRLFVTATARDDLDGLTDGFSNRASLYVIDLVQGEADSTFPYRVSISASKLLGSDLTDVGSSVVSPKGDLVIIGDGKFGGIRAFDAQTLEELWFLDSLGEGLATVSFASDENFGAVYGKSDVNVFKLALDELNTTPPQLLWTQSFDSSEDFVKMRPTSSIAIVGNGLAIGVSMSTTDRPYPLLKGLPVTTGFCLLDRETGEFRSFTITNGEVASEIAVGMDGSVYAVNEPNKRMKSVEVFSFGLPLSPLIGGISRFKPKNFLELARDASCAASKRIDNSLQYSGGWISFAPTGGEEAGREDARQTSALGWQAVVAFQLYPLKNATTFATVKSEIDLLAEAVGNGIPVGTSITASAAFSLMRTIKPSVEKICTELSSL